ncbi:MAG: arylesterase [Pseudomonadota bacterium]
MISRLVGPGFGHHKVSVPVRRALFAIATVAFVITVTLQAAVQFVAAAGVASGDDTAPIKIVAFGDSLVAGYGLDAGQGFPEQLEAALVRNGHKVEIVNAGVSGDTIEAASARLDWALGEGADGVIVVLGGNDFLRGVDPVRSRMAMDNLLARLAERKLPTLVAGMRAPLNFDPAYRNDFDAIYPELTAKHGAMLDPFFLEGVALVTSLNQPDGIHPNRDGVAFIVARMMPFVMDLLDKVSSTKAAG